MRTRLTWVWLLTACSLDACGPAPSGDDAGVPDASIVCSADEQCDDGLFCNGVERCMPGAIAASRLGCVAASSPACLAGQTCDETGDACRTECDVTADADGDGHDAIDCGGNDCDDADPQRFPGNTEICDVSHDEDCDGETFGDRDLDADGHVDDTCCNGALCGDDCDDSRANQHREAPEVCDGIDNDCNGVLDGPGEGGDRDGHADDLCAGDGASDCNDSDGDVYRGAPELCDGIDSDCSSCDARTLLCAGEGCASPTTACGARGSDVREDADGDLHAPVGAACAGGFPADDCDDAHATAHPGLEEICDGLDNDCNGTVDDPALVLAQCASAGATMGCDSAGGTCVVLRCDAGRADCDADPSNGCESTLATDAANCGACGVACGAGGECSAGVCDRVVQIEAGGSTTCAVRANGAVACWGLDDFGQLGDTGGDSQYAPVLVPGSTDARAVSVGYRTTCIVAADDSFRCHGVNRLDGGALRVRQVSCGTWSSCALDTSGGVWCWGANGAGELGDGTRVDSDVPVRVVGLSDAVQVGAGFQMACALRATGAVACWGGAWGSDVPIELPGAPAGIVQLDVSDLLVCARSPDEVVCWGNDSNGERGDGAGSSGFDVPAIAFDGPTSDLAVGDGYACALGTDQRLWCWGLNAFGQLGDGTTTNRDSPVIAGPSGLPFVDVVAGDGHTCALTRAGGVVCWGQNFNGQLGNGTTTGSHVPVGRAALGTVQVTVGGHTTCARSPHGAATCWGYDVQGQIGDGPLGGGATPQRVSGAEDWISIASNTFGSYGHVCGIRTDGTAWCWGYNGSGQLGDGTTIDREAPVRFGSATDVVQIAPGDGFTCALRASGAIECAGDATAGVLGAALTGAHPTPVAIAIDDGVQIATGAVHACARRASGEIACWGRNGRGQLGDGTLMRHAAPAPVVGLRDAAEISAGWAYTCARRTSGAVFCWGAGTEGQIGDGAREDRSTPTRVVDLPDDVVAITAHGLAHCARTRAGALYCWGANYAGGVGDGTTAHRTRPVPVPIADALSISTGDRTSCASRSSGPVMCWGQNYAGMIGDGTYVTPVLSPVYVIGP